jgi:hypothetical protein
MWIESFEDAKISLEINKNMSEAYEQAAIALNNLNFTDQAIEILKIGISGYKFEIKNKSQTENVHHSKNVDVLKVFFFFSSVLCIYFYFLNRYIFILKF